MSSELVAEPQAVAAARRTVSGRLQWLLNTDFFPGANRFVYWLKEPVGWFATGALFSALVGLYVSPLGWTVCGALVALIAGGLAFPWLAVRLVSCSLGPVQSVVREDESCELELEVRNRLPLPVWGLVVEGYCTLPAPEAALEQSAADLALASIPPLSRSRFRLPLRPEYRGQWPRLKPGICCSFPFGIWTARRPIETVRPLLVWPMQIPVSGELEPPGRRRAMCGDGQRAGDAGEYLGVRPWRQGDSLRNIRWSLSARRDELIVSERSAPEMPATVVRLDTSSCGGSDPLERRVNLAWRVRIAACLAGMLHARRQPPLLVIDGALHRSGSGNAGYAALMAAFSSVPLDPETGPPANGLLDVPAGHPSITVAAAPKPDPVTSGLVRVSVRLPSRGPRSMAGGFERMLDLDHDLVSQLDHLIQEVDHASMAA